MISCHTLEAPLCGFVLLVMLLLGTYFLRVVFQPFSTPFENVLSPGFVLGEGRRSQGDERKRSRLRLGCRRTLLKEKKKPTVKREEHQVEGSPSEVQVGLPPARSLCEIEVARAPRSSCPTLGALQWISPVVFGL